MKLVSYLLLIIFLTFITLPALVSLIDKSSDISANFNTSEEDSSKSYTKLKEVIKTSKSSVLFNPNILKTKQIIFEICIVREEVVRELLSPPPEFF